MRARLKGKAFVKGDDGMLTPKGKGKGKSKASKSQSKASSNTSQEVGATGIFHFSRRHPLGREIVLADGERLSDASFPTSSSCSSSSVEDPPVIAPPPRLPQTPSAARGSTDDIPLLIGGGRADFPEVKDATRLAKGRP